jgi:alpha-1,3-glucan synthase
MGDLLGFEGYLNESTPFFPGEIPVVWKGSRRYHDFDISHEYNETCQFPRLWDETGFPVGEEVMREFKGCYSGDFDQVRNYPTYE